MEIGGFQRVSLVDYPGKIASIVFVTGCNMRCPFCHNQALVLRDFKSLHIYSEGEILGKLERSKNFVEAVEITGGEPTLQRGLREFMASCKKMGFLLKLDTNGSNPQLLREILDEGLADYVAMDIKSVLEPDRYKTAAGIVNYYLLDKVEESIRAIMGSGIDYEFRTTVVPQLVEPGDLEKIAERIKGANAYYLQQFVPKNTLDPEFSKISPYPKEALASACALINERKLVKKCEVRG